MKFAKLKNIQEGILEFRGLFQTNCTIKSNPIRIRFSGFTRYELMNGEFFELFFREYEDLIELDILKPNSIDIIQTVNVKDIIGQDSKFAYSFLSSIRSLPESDIELYSDNLDFDHKYLDQIYERICEYIRC